MKIKIGHSRLYNAKAADHMDAKALGCTFKIGAIKVTAQVSTKTRHFYPVLTVESVIPMKNGFPTRHPVPGDAAIYASRASHENVTVCIRNKVIQQH